MDSIVQVVQGESQFQNPSKICSSLCKIFSPWGEHEIDYVLFFTITDKSELTLKPNPEEVGDTKWVTKQSLMGMMNDNTLLFSPWFRLICHKWLLPSWWTNLNETMNTAKHCDFVNIHAFDPPTEHLGGLGKAGPLLDSQEKNKKISTLAQFDER
jgi:hypothetical protein